MDTTTSQDKRRATKNIELELDRFKSFCTDLMAPVLTNIILDKTKYQTPVEMPVRSIADTYGSAAGKCFTILFKRMVPGGHDKEGKAFGSKWLPNLQGLSLFLEWRRTTDEMTCRSLYEYLVEHKAEPRVWVKSIRAWLTQSQLDQLREWQEASDEDGIDYNALYHSLISETNTIAA